MRIGVLGTGVVGRTIGMRLLGLGRQVCLGGRSSSNENAAAWVAAQGEQARASHGTFADAAAFGEVLFNCTAGMASIEALTLAGADNLAGKVLVDVANPLDYTHGFPPSLTVCNTDSLGEQIQRAFPRAKVVKALNTMTARVMVEPTLLPGGHDVFLCGDDAEAKARVIDLLHDFGWVQPVDLGDITSARGMEMLLPMWIRLYGVLQTADFNIGVARAR